MRRWVSSESYRQVIKAVAEVRKEAGVSQKQLAERLSKPPSFIAKIELGERRLDVLEFLAIAKALELDAPELLARIENQLPPNLDI